MQALNVSIGLGPQREEACYTDRQTHTQAHTHTCTRMQALSVSIDLGPQGVEACLKEAGVGFMYAPRYHPAMKAMRSVRGALKVRKEEREKKNYAGSKTLPASITKSKECIFTFC